MTPQPCYQTIAIHILAIYLKKWRQSDNEGWSVNRINMRKIFLEKSYTGCGGETSSRPLPEKLK